MDYSVEQQQQPAEQKNEKQKTHSLVLLSFFIFELFWMNEKWFILIANNFRSNEFVMFEWWYKFYS